MAQVPDKKEILVVNNLNGEWIPAVDPIRIGQNNFQTLKNYRYSDEGLETILGYSKINPTSTGAHVDLDLTGGVLQDYTSYTETDISANRVDVLTGTITVTDVDRDEDVMVYKDFTAGYFDEDFELKFSVTMATVTSLTSQIYVWGMSNTVGNLYTLITTPVGTVWMTIVINSYTPTQTFVLTMGERTSDAQFQTDTSITIAAGSVVDVIIRRVESIGSHGTMKAYLYVSGALIDTLTLTLREKQDFRYLYAMSSSNESMGSKSTSAVITNLYIDRPGPYYLLRSGFHLKKDQPQESHVLVQGWNTALTTHAVLQNITAIPSTGDFAATPVWTDVSGAGVGRFGPGPGGSIVYCNGKETVIWAGNEIPCFVFVTSTALIVDSVTNPRDFSDQIQNDVNTSSQIALVGGGKDANTVLLLHCDGPDESTTITDSSASAHTVTATNAKIDNDQAVFGNGSLRFDGTGDYITIPDHANFNLGNAVFTIDLRVRFNSIVGMQVLYMQKDATAGDHILLWQDHGEGKIHLQVVDGGTVLINESATWAPSAATWYHLALVRGWGGVADAWAITVNGTSIHTFTAAVTMPDHNQVVLIGGNLGNYGIDYTGRRNGFPATGGLTRNSTSKFAGASGSWAFDGTTGYFQLSDHADWDVIAQTNATLDLWVKHTDHDSSEIYIAHPQDAANNFWSFQHVHGAGEGVYFQLTTGGVNRVVMKGGEITDTNWHHLAVCKVGNDYGLYKNGVQIAYASYAGADTLTSALLVGTFFGVSATFDGNMQDIRITHANTFTAAPNVGLSNTITPPTAPVSSDANTKLLIRGGMADFNGWLDEIRLEKGLAAWSATFSPPIRAYIDNSLYWIVGSVRPLEGLKHYIQNGNTVTGATITGTYWNGHSWSPLISFVDNTNGLAVTGTQTWTSTVLDAKPKFLQSRYLYFYQFQLSAGSADIYYVTLNAPMQIIVDLWDGVYRTAGRFMSYTTTYNDFTYAVAEEDYESGNTATYAQVGALTAAQYLLAGFEERSSGIRISLAPGKSNTTGSTTAAVYYWDGSAWTSVGSVSDGTSVGAISLARSGVISWNPPAPESEFKTSVVLDIQLYYYKIVFDKTLSADVFIDQVSSVTAQNTKPRIYKFPFMLNERLFLCNSIATKEGNRVDFMAINTTGVLNGDDSSEGIPGPLYFGGADDLVSAISLYNRIGSTIYNVGIFCKAYETYILYTPSNVVDDWRQFTVSKTLGCASAATMDSAEIGFSISSGTEEAKRNIAMWLTFSGPVLFDMAVPVPAWRKIENYFDKTKAECINFTEIGRSFGFFDLDYSEYNLLIPSGSGQATINKWLVLDLSRFRWYEKVPPMYPQSVVKVQDTVGKTYHYGLFDDGYMRRLENNYTWDGASITSIAKTGEDIPSKDPFLKSMVAKVKILYKPTTEITSLMVRHYIDGESTGVTVVDITPDGVDRYNRKTSRILKGRGLSHAHEIECTTGASSPKGVIVMGLAYKWTIDMEDSV